MIHQPMGGAEGQASDIEIQAKEIMWLKKRLYEILALHTDKEIEQIEDDADRNYWMSAEEAESYGLVDNVLNPKNLKGLKSIQPNGEPSSEEEDEDNE
jgi:ATP-dependent Clp protease protease subunit